jgi:hypothetical protein
VNAFQVGQLSSIAWKLIWTSPAAVGSLIPSQLTVDGRFIYLSCWSSLPLLVIVV